MNKIPELKARITEARDAYYNLKPKISDQQYDAMIDELKQLDPKSLEVTAVGAPPPQYTIWEKVKHEIPMGSLNKVNSKDEFIEWAEKTKSEYFLITHKIDGISMELIYQNGKLQKAITRGDGIIGELVTSNIKQIPSIPKTIEIKSKVVIRGEVVMFKEMFRQKYAEEYANPRNIVSGKVRDKKHDGKACKDLEFIGYQIYCEDRPKTEWSQMKLINSLGFKIPDWTYTKLENICHKHEEITNSRDKIEYEIDGTVIRVGMIQEQEELGEQNMRPRGQIAWKFDHEMRESKIVDVRWQVGLTGRICPVAVIEPTQIGGVTITNISLHNLRLFNHLKLFRGCKVLISRRNDVIPYLEENIDLGIKSSSLD